ncbi:unnamed protein product [Mytilus coruscus]|uniref:Myb/SANT-like DNA-binding domain-containing protein n=1 Tax=Mytilus coruscus TaxID=42192 RepID=A0A6J8ETS1_MYTCO|nr:unnamed protein product [Mytilus coruscus]
MQKKKCGKKITAEVNALGVSYRQVLTVKTKFRNLTRDAKDKFTYEKRERNRTGGGPAPKPIRFPQQTETSESRPTQFSIQESSSSDPIYFAEPVSSHRLLPQDARHLMNHHLLLRVSGLGDWNRFIREMKKHLILNMPTYQCLPKYLLHLLIAALSNHQKASENKRTKKPKRTA